MSSREHIIRFGPRVSNEASLSETPLSSASIGSGSASAAAQEYPPVTEASKIDRPAILDITDHPLFEARAVAPLRMAAGCDAIADPDTQALAPTDENLITSSLDPLRPPVFPHWFPSHGLGIPETPCANDDDPMRIGGAASGGLSRDSGRRDQPEEVRSETARDVKQRMLREFSSALRGKFGLNEDNIRNIVDAAERLFGRLELENSQDFQSLATHKGTWELGYEPGGGVFLCNRPRKIYLP